MKRFTIFSLLLLPLIAVSHISAHPDGKISYTVDIDTAGHYLNVHMTYTRSQPSTSPLKLKLPVWAPGYYLIVDYPKYLTDFNASANRGPASWIKQGKNSWIITAPEADTLRASYRIFCNERSVAESRVESGMAFIAPNGVFMHPDNPQHDVTISYNIPTNWSKISSGLLPIPSNRPPLLTTTSATPSTETQNSVQQIQTFYAPTFDQLYDSPFLLGNHHTHSFTHEGHRYDVALETPDGYAESGIESDWKKVISATTRLMGDVPYDNYCLMHLGEGRGGLEHFNSQACYSNGTWRFPTRAEYINYLGFITHEYFHLYNVKSIRPIELGPFDYDREVWTPMLWVSEGITVYYETQLMLRAGIISADELLSELSGYIRQIETSEGQQHMSLRQSSYDIWHNFFNTSANHDATTISYYIKGPVIALLFDCFIRNHTAGQQSLDNLMRLLYQRFYKQAQRGFTEEEFWQCADEIAGTSTAPIRHLVETTTPIDYESLLTPLGLNIDRNTWQLSRQTKPTKAAGKLRKALLLE